MRHILVATDFSQRSDVALARAAELAERFSAKLTVLHVVERDQPVSLFEAEVGLARAVLAEHVKDVAAGVATDMLVETGDPFEQIGRVANEQGCDLIVIGRHRKRLLRDVFVGTTAERVVWHGTHPVLLVKAETTTAYQRVAIAIDGSEPCAEALRVVKALHLMDGTAVQAIHANEPIAKKIMAGHPDAGAVRDQVDSELISAREDLAKFLEECGHGDLASTIHIDDGAPIEVLRSCIKDGGTDLLVVGTHGRSGLGRLVLGSVAEEALRTLEVDILAVPPSKGVSAKR